jgi:hypothetical protein
MTFQRASTLFLGAGSLVFGLWGALSPRTLAQAAGDDPDLAPYLGARDTVIGAALMTSGGPIALGARVASDLSDAWRLRDRSPKIAAGALGFAILGGVAMMMAIEQRHSREREARLREYDVMAGE